MTHIHTKTLLHLFTELHADFRSTGSSTLSSSLPAHLRIKRIAFLPCRHRRRRLCLTRQCHHRHRHRHRRGGEGGGRGRGRGRGGSGRGCGRTASGGVFTLPVSRATVPALPSPPSMFTHGCSSARRTCGGKGEKEEERMHKPILVTRMFLRKADLWG